MSEKFAIEMIWEIKKQMKDQFDDVSCEGRDGG